MFTKKRFLPTLIVLSISLLCCSRPNATEKDLCKTLNGTIHLEAFDIVRQGNVFLPLDELKGKYDCLSVVYLEDGCQSCYPKFIEWHQKFDSITVPDNYSVLFVIQGRGYSNFMSKVLDLDYVDDKYYTIIDTGGIFLEANKDIPRWIIDASVLIDSENKIKMVGKPWTNEDMMTLFNKTVGREQ